MFKTTPMTTHASKVHIEHYKDNRLTYGKMLTVWLALSQLFLLLYIALSSRHRVTLAVFPLLASYKYTRTGSEMTSATQTFCCINGCGGRRQATRDGLL